MVSLSLSKCGPIFMTKDNAQMDIGKCSTSRHTLMINSFDLANPDLITPRAVGFSHAP